jgi:hypothetical protein
MNNFESFRWRDDRKRLYSDGRSGRFFVLMLAGPIQDLPKVPIALK